MSGLSVSSSGGELLVGDGGEVIDASPEACALLRRTRKELREIGLRGILDHESPASRSAWARLKNREGFEGELRLRRGDGTVFLAEVSVSELRDGAFAVKLRDLTEKERAERVSRWAERHFGAQVRRAVDFHVVQDAESVIVHASPEVEKHLGRKPEEIAGSKLQDHIHPDDLSWAGPDLEKVVETPLATAKVKARFRHRDGSWRHFEVVVSNLIADPSVNGLVWHFRDVSEEVTVRDDLRHARAQMRALVEGAQDMITLCSDANTILYASPSYKRILGYEPEEMIGLYVPSVIHPDDLQTAFEYAARISSDPAVTDIPPIRYRHKDGSYVYLESVFTNLINDPEIRAIAIHSRDVTERVEAENRFRALVENTTDLITLAEPDNTIRYISPASKTILGYDPEELIGTSVADVLHPDELEVAARGVMEINETPGPTEPRRFRFRHKDGSYKVLETIYNNRLDDPDVRGIVCNSRDVTEQARAEEAKRKTETWFKQLTHNAPDFVSVTDEEGVLLYINPSHAEALGCAVEELLGEPIHTFVHPDDLETMAGAWEKALSLRGESYLGPPVRLVRKDGSHLHVQGTCNNLLDDPNIGGLVFNVRDVTERVEFERKLRESEERYRLLVEQVPAVNYTLAPAPEGAPGTMTSGSVSYISPAVEKVLGYPPERFIQEPLFWSSLVHPDDLERVLAEDVRTDETGDAFEMEYRMRHRDGHHLWVKDDAALIRNEQGDPLLWQCVLVDITARREAEEEVRHLNEDLERRVEERTAQLRSAMEEAEDSEELMRLSERRFRSLVQHASDITAILDEGGSVRYTSPAIERVLGYGIGELVEESALGYVHPDDLEETSRTFERVRESEGVMAGAEFRFRHKNGSWRRLEAVFNNLSGEPCVEGIVVNARDVTERKAAEERLRENLDVLLALYETGQVLTSTLDLEERGEKLLEITVRLFGLSAAAINLRDDDGKLRLWRTTGPEEVLKEARAAPEAGEARRLAASTGEPRVFRLPAGDPPVGACLPLKGRDRSIGVLEAFGPEGLTGQANAGIFVSLGGQAGSALENARLYGDLAEREARLEDLVGRLITAQEEERRRVAYDVHDGLAQTALAAHQHLQVFLEDHPPGSTVREGELNRVLDLVRRTGKEARRVIADLRPTVLDDFGLAAALQRHVETLRTEGMRIEYSGDLEGRRLPAPIETALYRVAQEALNNVRKHAGDAGARVSLERRGRDVRLEVRDRGPGFDPSEARDAGGPSERVGLSSMRERVALIGGRFEIKSGPKTGTTVTAEVPLPEEDGS
ncbi:MAG: PAS domain S-box protein [Rubrobacteraceae bacterium]